MKYIFIFAAVFIGGSAVNSMQPDPIYKETEVRNQRPKLNAEIFYENERSEAMRLQFPEADRIVERKVGNVERNSKFIIVFWAEKKTVLSKKFGIHWKSPAELNPSVCYLNYGQPCITSEEKKELMTLVYKKQSQQAKLFKEFTGSSMAMYI